ncbi:MAG: hypothetical protein mread185_000160 [Mycoplasmataceae bacterium]|nr:MAG: hypothetical protein mread185_000160 [Mycoplasmataceae bacterium]
MKKKSIIPSLLAKCFRCQKKIEIKYILPQKRYSWKNDWSFWTGEEGEKRICDDCLKKFYFDDKPLFWAKVKDLKKRQLLSNYISNKII